MLLPVFLGPSGAMARNMIFVFAQENPARIAYVDYLVTKQ